MYHLAIVDDNESWCYVLALRLQQQGYTVSTFANAHAFLQDVDRFDLVLVDFSMPTPRYQSGMDGPELICRVKQRMENPPILVLISSFFTEDMLGHFQDFCPEADAILSKQLEPSQIFSKVKQLLVDREQTQQERYRFPSGYSPNRTETPLSV